MTLLLCAVIGSLAFLVKGGQHGRIPGVTYLQNLSWISGRILDGKILSTVMIFCFAGLLSEATYQGIHEGIPVYSGFDPKTGFLYAVCWLASVSPAFGAYVGAMGGLRGYWNSNTIEISQIDRLIKPLSQFPRWWGLAGMTLRGALMGLLFMLLTHNILALPLFAFAFPAAYYLGITLMQIITRSVHADWVFGEVLIGVVIGAFIGFTLL